jgi:hypothetical protein
MNNTVDFGRKNNALKAEIDLSKIYASGGFKNVYKGKYTDGERKGQECVTKVFKTGSVYEESFFASELKVVAKALQIINRFNSDRIIDKEIWLNEPTVWTFINGHLINSKALTEPMIDNFEKFNSNTGWTPNQTSPWIEVMQALR